MSWTTTLAAFVVYHTVAEGALGTTVGKRVMGLRVVTLELRPPSFRQAFQRSAGFFIDSFFFFLIAARAMSDSPIRQRVGDGWAGYTRVVYQRTLQESAWPRGALFAGVMSGATLAAGRVFALGEYLSYLWLTKDKLSRPWPTTSRSPVPAATRSRHRPDLRRGAAAQGEGAERRRLARVDGGRPGDAEERDGGEFDREMASQKDRARLLDEKFQGSDEARRESDDAGHESDGPGLGAGTAGARLAEGSVARRTNLPPTS